MEAVDESATGSVYSFLGRRTSISSCPTSRYLDTGGAVQQFRGPLASEGAIGGTTGSRAAHTWLAARSLTIPPHQRWHANITFAPDAQQPAFEIDESTETRFRLDIYSEEWGFFFCHHSRASWIRITDVPFVHGRDDYQLLGATPALAYAGALVRWIESQHALHFDREHALVRTNVTNAEPAIRSWIELF